MIFGDLKPDEGAVSITVTALVAGNSGFDSL
jgi:hypothetical protein